MEKEVQRSDVRGKKYWTMEEEPMMREKNFAM
jgi:hypothetical protein